MYTCRNHTDKSTCLNVGLVWLLLSGAAVAQSASEERVRAVMAESLRRQQTSVSIQMKFQQEYQAGITLRTKTKMVSPRQRSLLPQSIFHPPCLPVPTKELQPQIEQAALQHDLSANLLRAVAHAESGFVPCAVSLKGAVGLMQIMPVTAKDLGLRNPMDPQQSLSAGAKYLRQLLDRYNGDVRLALGAYNAGPARVDRYGDVPPFNETRSYVSRILSEFTSSQPMTQISPILDPR